MTLYELKQLPPKERIRAALHAQPLGRWPKRSIRKVAFEPINDGALEVVYEITDRLNFWQTVGEALFIESGEPVGRAYDREALFSIFGSLLTDLTKINEGTAYLATRLACATAGIDPPRDVVEVRYEQEQEAKRAAKASADPPPVPKPAPVTPERPTLATIRKRLEESGLLLAPWSWQTEGEEKNGRAFAGFIQAAFQLTDYVEHLERKLAQTGGEGAA